MGELSLFPEWLTYGYVSEEAFMKQIACYKWLHKCGVDIYSRIHQTDMNRHSYFLHIENFFKLNRRKRK